MKTEKHIQFFFKDVIHRQTCFFQHSNCEDKSGGYPFHSFPMIHQKRCLEVILSNSNRLKRLYVSYDVIGINVQNRSKYILGLRK